jgi:hypothetical protein
MQSWRESLKAHKQQQQQQQELEVPISTQDVQPSSHSGSQLSSLLLQQLLQDEEEGLGSDDPGLADVQDAAVCEQQQQQQQPQVLAVPSSWAPALSPVREDAVGEQPSPEKASCNAGAADGAVQQQTLQLRVALAAAQSELDTSRQLIELLSAEYPDTAQLLEAGAKQEQARQEVG